MHGKTRYYLIACGTSEYDDNYNPLPSVNEDLKTVVEVFTQHFGYERVLEDLQSNPRAEELKRQFADWLQDKDRRETDIVIFYYSGHGDSLPGDGHYLVMKDTIIDQIGTTVLLTKDLVRPLINKGVKISQILYIIDTCHSGSGAIDVTNFALNVIQQYQPVEKKTNIAVHAIAACRAKQTANEGVFSNALANAVKKLCQDVGLQTLGYINLDKLIEEIKQNNTSEEQHVQYSIAGTETSAKFFPILPKTLQTWKENRYDFIEELLKFLRERLDDSLFLINSFLLSSKFIEEFVLDEPDLKEKLKDLSITPVSDGICPLIACSEWCRKRFSERGNYYQPSLAQNIEEWQRQVIEYRTGVDLRKIQELVRNSFNQLKKYLKDSEIRLQIEIEPELDHDNNTGQLSGSLLLNMNLWVKSKDLPLARYAENVRLDLKKNKQNTESESDSLYTCLQDIFPDLIQKAHYSLHILLKGVKLEIEFFLPLDYYNTPIDKISVNDNRDFSKLGKLYRVFINSFERYFDEYFFRSSSDIDDKKDRLWKSNNDSCEIEFPGEDIFYIGTEPSLSELKTIEESIAIAVWSRNKSKPLVEGDEGHIKRAEWRDWRHKIHELRKQKEDLEITLFWDDLYPKPSRRCRPFNTGVVE
ncbi:caspase family protein [Scytonema sp. UIC 10036]|uniref:caspase family protein n=1 Tax=Scytonema sp. UIC 10036 TaxID=2304196 RepID=UPI0012DA0CA5|nr:caspase family protein [Scytonema sp. UIC 10036]MUG93037.1 caspase family protein [Scytonema sp. UIC 10036]